MIVDLEKAETASEYQCSIVLVGAGAVGTVMAAHLARKGFKVLLLEGGGMHLEERSQAIFTNARSTGFKLEGLHSGRFRLLGGTTNFWGGQLVRFDPIVFEDRPWIQSARWPFGRAVLDYYYDKALDLLGMSNCERDDLRVWDALRATPPQFDENIELFLTRWLGTPNLARHFSNDLLGSNIEVLLHANVVGLEVNEEGNRVSRVHVRTFGGRDITVTAGDVVLACGTFEIIRLLLLPDRNGRELPWSKNPWLGRGYLDHLATTAGEVVPINREAFRGIFENIFINGYKYNPKLKLTEEAQRDYRLVGVAGEFIYRTSYEEHARTIKAFLRAIQDGRLPENCLELPRHIASLWRVALPLAFRYFRMNRSFHPSSASILFRVTSEQIASKESRVRLRTERDALDVPMIDVNWNIEGSEIESIAYFAEKVRDSLKNRGLAEIRLEPALTAREKVYLSEPDDTYHQMGGARIGRDETDGVVDANLRVYGVKNLYVAGAVVMPSSGFPNCTFTAIALAIRLCDHLTSPRAGRD